MLREARGWSVNRLATEADVDRGNLWRLEKGQTSAREETLEKVARALGVKLWEIYYAAEEIGDNRQRLRLLEVSRRMDESELDAFIRLFGDPPNQQARQTNR